MKIAKKTLSVIMAALMVLSCWVWTAPDKAAVANAADAQKDHYLFAYFTGNSSDGQTVHLAVSDDGLYYTALRNNEPIIIPSKGTGAVRDPYIWYNEQDDYYYLICTDMDAADNQWWDNTNSFLMWRSKDLIHWYDETYINVYDMLQLFDQTVGIVHRAWAPQIMWDGQSYIIYFSIDTDNVSYPADQLSIVYFRTTDLMDLSQYYEYGGIFYPGYDVNDAEIIQHPTNGKWYLFYKPEATTEYPTTKINMMVSDNATGPYTSADSSSDRGLDIYSTVTEALEGCNGYFDNEGNLVMYADAYGHSTSYFYIAKTDADGDYMSWDVYGEDSHNINSLSPRHGSVVKITAEEYNNLLNNAYGITASSFSATEELSDHLVGRYFTTADAKYNAANGKNDLTVASIAMYYYNTEVGNYGYFDGTNSYALINLKDLVPNGLNYDDGFTITFTALLYGNDNSRIYSITDGTNTTNLASNSTNGAYVTNNTTTHTTSVSLYDSALHDYIISYANGNIIIYKDGELLLKKNCFNDGIMTEDWYNAISNGTLYIGASGAETNLVLGGIADFCIYDCSLSYYDVKTIQNEMDIEEGLAPETSTISSLGSVVPSWEHSATLTTDHYANVLYSPYFSGAVSGDGWNGGGPNPTNQSDIPALIGQVGNTHYGMYYANNTVLYIDGINTPKMPVMFAGRINKNSYESSFSSIYPAESEHGSHSAFYFDTYWEGWKDCTNYMAAFGAGQTIGYSNSTSASASLDEGNTQGDRCVCFYANTLKVNSSVDLGDSGYKVYKPNWQIIGDADGTNIDAYAASNFNIYVVNLKPFVTAYNAMAAEYNSIVTNTSYCPAAIANYKAIVDEMKAFAPASYDYASDTAIAVAACYAQSQKLIADYNTVKSQLGPCNDTVIEGKEATCTANGTTDGHYCSICGEISVEQEIITKLAHSFGDRFTGTDGKTYVQCSLCGISHEVKDKEIRYENLFSYVDFYNSHSYNGGVGHNATCAVDFEKNTISVTNTHDSDEGYTYASHTNKNYANYCIKVDPSTTYTIEYFVTTAQSFDVFVFYYTKDQAYIDLSNKNASTSQLYNYTFTTPSNCKYIEIRFDSNTAGQTVTFADFGIYPADSAEYLAQNPYSRLLFETDDSKALYTPKKIGYEFLGWYTSDGTKFENTNQVSASVTVFAKWRELGNSINYNGNLFSLTDYASTNAYMMQSNIPDAHIWADFENGTLNTISAREGNYKASDTAVSLSLDTYNNPTPYKVQVTSGEEYVFTMTLADKSRYQCYLWFYDANGSGVTHPATNQQWINHSTNNSANGAVASWDSNTLIIRFTVPASATQMAFRMGTTGEAAFTQTFSNIGLYSAEDYEIYMQMNDCPATTYVPNAETTELASPTRENFEFAGWNTGKYGTGSDFSSANTASMTADKKVYPKWKITSDALTEDHIVIDFDSPITFNPIENDTIAIDEAALTSGNYALKNIETDETQGTFTVNSNNCVTYTPAQTITSTEFVSYTATLTAYGMDTEVEGYIVVAPASNILYEEDKLTVSNTTGNAWSDVGTVATAEQSSADEVYGYDSTYNTFDTYSGGAAKKVSVSSTAKRGQIMSFSFSGTGFDLYSQCAADTGILIVTVKNNDTGSMVNASIVDTYYSTTLNQVPVVGIRDLDYGSYTVQVSAMYLSTAGALQGTSTQAAFGLGDITMYSAPMSSAEMLYTALEEVGLEEIFEADDLQVIWFDEGSVFANGSAAATYTLDTETETVSTRAIPEELVCVIDSVRVYNPGNPDIINEYYPASEQGASYYNIMSNLKSGTLTNGNGSFGYVSYTIDDEEIDFDTYETKGSNEEVYLASDNENAGLAFGISGIANGGKIMISLRAADGKATTAKIGENTIAINSATEMYYDVTDYITDGTIAIQNIGDGLLAIGNVKATGAAAPIVMSTFNMRAARMMMMAPVASDESEAPEEPSTEETTTEEPTTEEATTSDTGATDSSSNEKSLLDKLYDFIDFIVALIKKIFSTLDFMKNL